MGNSAVARRDEAVVQRDAANVHFHSGASRRTLAGGAGQTWSRSRIQDARAARRSTTCTRCRWSAQGPRRWHTRPTRRLRGPGRSDSQVRAPRVRSDGTPRSTRNSRCSDCRGQGRHPRSNPGWHRHVRACLLHPVCNDAARSSHQTRLCRNRSDVRQPQRSSCGCSSSAASS